MERKNSVEAKSLLVENESGKGVHNQKSNADLNEVADPTIKEHLNQSNSGNS